MIEGQFGDGAMQLPSVKLRINTGYTITQKVSKVYCYNYI